MGFGNHANSVTVAPRYNEPRYSEDPVITNNISNGRSNPEVVGSIPTEVKRFFLYLVLCGSLIPFTRANAQWVIHGFYLTIRLRTRVFYEQIVNEAQPS